ncbi:MAG: tetratricopeptide repeat protein [Desulfobacterales bacterium]|nr:tetratricopeptide repeat protein [Desulfobacterales bacterium]
MKRNCYIWLGCIILIGVLAACASTSTEQKKKEAEVTRRLGEAYLQQGNFSGALKEFKKAEAKYPDDHLLQYDLGLLYALKERYDEAIVHYKKALELSPTYGPAMNSLANAYAGKKEWDQAIVYYRKVINDILYATPHFAYTGLGNAYYYKGELQRSEKNYLEALKIKPDFTKALQGLSETYIAMGRVPEAIERLEKAVRLEPKSAPLHFQLARAYQVALEFEKAYRSYQKVIELAPETGLADQAEEGAREVRKYM